MLRAGRGAVGSSGGCGVLRVVGHTGFGELLEGSGDVLGDEEGGTVGHFVFVAVDR